MGVLIVGSGPAGATLAYLLARNGVDVTLLERETDFSRTFRGEGLMPSGVDALIQMGLYDLLDTMPTRTLESWDVYVNARKVMRVEEPFEALDDRSYRVPGSRVHRRHPRDQGLWPRSQVAFASWQRVPAS